MTDPEKPIALEKRIGVAADHGGFELKEYLKVYLLEKGYKVTDYGAKSFNPNDDYPDYIFPLAHALRAEDVSRGIAVCGSGVGACVAANKVAGVRACLIHDTFSAHQGVEDDNINMLCLGGKVLGTSFAKELVQTFLTAMFTGAERHRRRLDKVKAIENLGSI